MTLILYEGVNIQNVYKLIAKYVSSTSGCDELFWFSAGKAMSGLNGGSLSSSTAMSTIRKLCQQEYQQDSTLYTDSLRYCNPLDKYIDTFEDILCNHVHSQSISGLNS
jgi:hypothetical protein